jgi:hypothetical protein
LGNEGIGFVAGEPAASLALVETHGTARITKICVASFVQ